MRYLGLREQLMLERTKTQALQERCKDLEDALIEVAELVAANEEAIRGGEDIPAENPGE